MKQENRWHKIALVTIVYCVFLWFAVNAWGLTPSRGKILINKIEAVFTRSELDVALSKVLQNYYQTNFSQLSKVDPNGR